jgi:hypothetical protein
MNATKLSLWALPALAASAIALSGCGGRSAANPTTISYHQVGVCRSYDVPTGTEKARPDQGFAVFKIETIDNSKQNSSFQLDPERLYVDQTKPEDKDKSLTFQNRRFITADPRFAKSMGVKPLEGAIIPANQKVDVNSFVVVPLSTKDPSGADQSSFDLLYDTSTTEKQWGDCHQKNKPA